MDVKYEDDKHRKLEWREFSQYDRRNWPEKKGYYTVKLSRHCHWYVGSGYKWDGDTWRTEAGTLTKCVVAYLPGTYTRYKRAKKPERTA